MPISKLSALGACVGVCLGGASPQLASAQSVPAQNTPSLDGPSAQSLSVQGGALIVAGPPGYCVDSTVSQDGPGGAFVMLGDCAQLNVGSQNSPEQPAVLTATISSGSRIRQRPSTAQLEAFFRAPEGLAALSLDGTADTVTVQRTRIAGDVLFLLVTDTSAARPAGLSDTSWRAVFTLNDRFVSLTAAAQAEAPVPLPDLQTLLDAFLHSMLDANPTDTHP